MHSLGNEGIQQIITIIQSDIPNNYEEVSEWITNSEIIVRLHDDGEKGRLFKIQTW